MSKNDLVAINGGGMSYERHGDTKSTSKNISTTNRSQALQALNGLSSYDVMMELVRRHWKDFVVVVFALDISYRVINFVMNGV